MISSAVREAREETEELTDCSRMRNCLGLLAHSLLLRSVFMADWRERCCRKWRVSARLRRYFSSISARMRAKASRSAVRLWKYSRLSMAKTLAVWLSQRQSCWQVVCRARASPSPRISPACTITKGTSLVGSVKLWYWLIPRVLRSTALAECLATAFISLNSPECTMKTRRISSPSWKSGCPQASWRSWRRRAMVSSGKAWSGASCGSVERKRNLLRLSVRSCALSSESQAFFVTVSRWHSSTATAFVARMLTSPIIYPKQPPPSITRTIFSMYARAGGSYAGGFSPFCLYLSTTTFSLSKKSGKMGFYWRYSPASSFSSCLASRGSISSGMVRCTFPSSTIQKQLEGCRMRQTCSPALRCAYSTFCASSERSLKLLAISAKKGSSCISGTSSCTVRKDRSFALEDSRSSEIRLLLDGLQGEAREKPFSVEPRLSLMPAYISQLTCIGALKQRKRHPLASRAFLPAFPQRVIKLMQKDFRMEREVPYLSEQDFKKLFPQEYFSKYAEHLNILRFEEAVFKEARPGGEKKFTDRRRSGSEGTLRQPGRVRLNRYDPVGDTIAKNKGEAVRMEKFVRGLNQKLKQGPAKSSLSIRTPLHGFGEVPEAVFDKMRLIENEEYACELQRLREKRRSEDEFVRFQTRNRSTSPSKFSLRLSRSILADSVESRSIRDTDREVPARSLSNTMQLHPLVAPSEEGAVLGSQSLNYQQRLQRLMAQARSEVVGVNPESRHADVEYIMALNRSIRKINTLKDEMRSERRKRTVAEWRAQASRAQHPPPEREELKRKKNLIAMTEGIRKEGEQIELLSRYKELLRERQFKEFLLQKENTTGLAQPAVPQ